MPQHARNNNNSNSDTDCLQDTTNKKAASKQWKGTLGSKNWVTGGPQDLFLQGLVDSGFINTSTTWSTVKNHPEANSVLKHFRLDFLKNVFRKYLKQAQLKQDLQEEAERQKSLPTVDYTMDDDGDYEEDCEDLKDPPEDDRKPAAKPPAVASLRPSFASTDAFRPKTVLDDDDIEDSDVDDDIEIIDSPPVVNNSNWRSIAFTGEFSTPQSCLRGTDHMKNTVCTFQRWRDLQQYAGYIPCVLPAYELKSYTDKFGVKRLAYQGLMPMGWVTNSLQVLLASGRMKQTQDCQPGEKNAIVLKFRLPSYFSDTSIFDMTAGEVPNFYREKYDAGTAAYLHNETVLQMDKMITETHSTYRRQDGAYWAFSLILLPEPMVEIEDYYVMHRKLLHIHLRGHMSSGLDQHTLQSKEGRVIMGESKKRWRDDDDGAAWKLEKQFRMH